MSHRRTPRAYSALSVRTPPAPDGLRVGLYGGSFDPPHAGHVGVSLAALRRLRLDRLWWIVSPGNPLKSRRSAPLADRLAQSRRLISDPRIVPTGIENDLGVSFTVETIEFLSKRYPRTHFVWIMGADNLAGFHRWRGWRRIAGLATLAVVDRPGWRFRALASPAARALASCRVSESSAGRLASLKPPAWVYLTVRMSPLASSEIRAKTKN